MRHRLSSSVRPPSANGTRQWSISSPSRTDPLQLHKHVQQPLGVLPRAALHIQLAQHGRRPLRYSLDGQTIDVRLTPRSKLASLHGDVATVTELTTCNYGLDPAHQDIASSGGMIVSGVDDTGEVRAVERPDHPFFLATLYQPQLRSTAAQPHPVWLGFLQACRGAVRA